MRNWYRHVLLDRHAVEKDTIGNLLIVLAQKYTYINLDGVVYSRPRPHDIQHSHM